MRALLLSNVNMQPIAAFLKPWEVVCSEYNSILIDLTDHQSAAYSSDFTHVLCLIHGDAMMGDALYGEGAPEQCEAYLNALELFCSANPGKTVIANLFCFGVRRWLSFADPLHPLSLRSAELRLNERMIAIARSHLNLLLLDTDLLIRKHGEESSRSDAFWYLGRIPYSNLMFKSLATAIQQASAAYANRGKKVLVLDLDNTLWGGVVGEAGPSGIVLSEDGVGRCYRDFQRALKAIKRTGVLLAICSKNNREDLDEVFERNAMMILGPGDFACIRANWEPKPQNIVDIAETLNLNVDSLVFIDDNPVERDLVRTALPDVVVPDFPARVENLTTWFMQELVPAHFAKYRLTDEDANKSEQYRAHEVRRQLSRSLDLDSFLEDLKIECVIRVNPAEQIARIAQMTQKTNQFNLTTRRYEMPAITQILNSTDSAVLLLEYTDRFSSEGAVGLAILDFANTKIDTFLLSCRVIGRRVEDRLLSEVYNQFRMRGLSRIVAEFIPTRKNQQVSSFYDNHGFSLVSQAEDGSRIYERLLA
jgi:FkbH-like protein